MQPAPRIDIYLQPDVSLDEKVSSFVVVLYCGHLSELLKVIQKEPQCPGPTSLIRRDGVVWLTKRCEGDGEMELDQIQRLVGLSATTLCLDLPNGLEAFIEKAFGNVKNHISCSGRSNKLIFVKDIYKEKESVSDTKYFDNVEKATSWLLKGNHQVTAAIQVADLLQIYDCQNPKNVQKVKTIHEKYQEILSKEEKSRRANALIFDQTKSKAIVQSEISDMKLSKQEQGKLTWKLEQMHRYRSWMEEEEEEKVLNKINKLTFEELDDKIGFMATIKHHKEWSKNSFEKLKELFAKIGSTRDITAMKEFQKEYRAMKANLQALMKATAGTLEGNIFREMENQLSLFYEYHNRIIEDETLSSLNFLKEEAKYRWKYQNNFYKKMAVFFLLGGLGYLQKDYIWGFTLLILAILTLTLRC